MKSFDRKLPSSRTRMCTLSLPIDHGQSRERKYRPNDRRTLRSPGSRDDRVLAEEKNDVNRSIRTNRVHRRRIVTDDSSPSSGNPSMRSLLRLLLLLLLLLFLLLSVYPVNSRYETATCRVESLRKDTRVQLARGN